MKIDRKALRPYLQRIGWREEELERLLGCRLKEDVSREAKEMIWQLIQHEALREAVMRVVSVFPKVRLEAIRKIK